jgi:2-polyprenyl-3-methyl-5-hydroxy-6-metoxy-1,4-benzoquinol methylase
MRASDREDKLYEDGKRVEISYDENFMFDFLERYAKNESKVLDVGCGTGEISLKISESGHNTIGLDFSKIALDVAKYQGVDCFWCDLDEGISQPSNFFDIVWAGDVVEHVFDPLGLISEVERVLNPDGLFLFSIPYDLHIANRIRSIFGISYQEPIYKALRQCKHHTFFTDSLAEYMLAENNFKVLDKVYINRIPKTNKLFSTRFKYSRIIGHSIVYAAKKIND